MSKLKRTFSFFPKSIKKFFLFLKDVKKEMKQVKWATAKEMRKYTFVVLVISLIMVLYFVGLDYLIVWIKGLFS